MLPSLESRLSKNRSLPRAILVRVRGLSLGMLLRYRISSWPNGTRGMSPLYMAIGGAISRAQRSVRRIAMAVSLLAGAAKAEVGHAAIILSRRLTTIAAGTTQGMRGGLPLSTPARVLIVKAFVWTFGVIGGGVFVIVGIVPIGTPLPYISRHVVEAVSIGGVGFDGSCGIRRFEDAPVIGFLFVGWIVTPGIFGLGTTRAAGVFPFGFGGQARVQIVAISFGVVIGDVDNGVGAEFRHPEPVFAPVFGRRVRCGPGEGKVFGVGDFVVQEFEIGHCDQADGFFVLKGSTHKKGSALDRYKTEFIGLGQHRWTPGC